MARELQQLMDGPRFEDLPENERARVYALLKRAMFVDTRLAVTFAAAINTLTDAAGDKVIPQLDR